MTPTQYLHQHPQTYLLVTREFGYPLFIIEGGEATDSEEEAKASPWDSLSNTDTRLSYFKAVTGYEQLKFEEIK